MVTDHRRYQSSAGPPSAPPMATPIVRGAHRPRPCCPRPHHPRHHPTRHPLSLAPVTSARPSSATSSSMIPIVHGPHRRRHQSSPASSSASTTTLLATPSSAAPSCGPQPRQRWRHHQRHPSVMPLIRYTPLRQPHSARRVGSTMMMLEGDR